MLGPGSLFTSVLPNLLVQGIADALRETRGVVIWVANLVGEPGETARLDAAAHLRAIEAHAGEGCVEAVLVHRGEIDAATVARYESEGSTILDWPDSLNGLPVHEGNLVGPGPKLRHDPEATAEALVAVWRKLRADNGGHAGVSR